MRISEIYRSLQGESTYAGLPCTFVRTAGCSLRCRYCDTGYALPFHSGEEMPLETVLELVKQLGADLVEVTGGEPLEEPETPALCERLLALGAVVLIETSGAFAIEALPAGVIRIMDIKTPSSRMQSRNRWENLAHLTERDEIKFVISDRADFDWAVAVCREHHLFDRCPVLLSASHGVLPFDTLAGWIIAERIPARMQLQMHKFIWPEAARGV